VGLPFDPDLYDHMLSHGVFIEDVRVRLAHFLPIQMHQSAEGVCHACIRREHSSLRTNRMIQLLALVPLQPSVLEPIVAAVIRFAAPLIFAFYLIQFSFRLGIKRRPDRYTRSQLCQPFSKKPGSVKYSQESCIRI
jgi:hypothetical protein